MWKYGIWKIINVVLSHATDIVRVTGITRIFKQFKPNGPNNKRDTVISDSARSYSLYDSKLSMFAHFPIRPRSH